MKYIDALQKLGKDYDPFLHIQKEAIVDESKSFFVIATRAPYVENHLLIIPKRKVYLLKDLNLEEKEDMRELLGKWTNNLHKRHKDVNLLLRDGLVGGNGGKSINHLHFHLIPDCRVTAASGSESRIWFNDSEYKKVVKKIKKDFL